NKSSDSAREEPVAIADTTKSLGAFESAEEQVNQPKTVEAEKEGTAKTFYASADMPAQSDPLGPIHEESRIINTKIDKLESSITKKVSDQSSVPSIVSNSLREVQQSLQNQLPKILLKPMNKEFNALDTLECRRFVMLQRELSKVIRTKMGKSVKAKMPKIPKLKSFITLDGELTQEDIIAQVKEKKRLADLKAEKEKSTESLKRIMNLANIKAQAQKIAEYEAKRTKMLKKYNDYINQRVDELPITKISYSSSNDATMRITRGNDPLNDVVHNKFRLKTLSFNVDDEPTAQSIFMANLSSAGLTNQQADISNASILSKVHNLKNVIDLYDDNQDEHEIHNEVQQKNTIDSTRDHMDNSNVTLYEHYLSVNDVSVVPSCAFFVSDYAYVLHDNVAYVPHDPLVTELNMYKENL
nr:hypothetical protein [Tanacetum cinerariifolium]